MSTTGLDAATLARSLRRMAGDGSVEWVMEPIQSSVLRDIADMLDENAKLREEVEQWHRLTAGIELPEYPITQFKPKDLERENAKLQASNEVIAEDHAALCEQNAKLRELAQRMWRLERFGCYGCRRECDAESCYASDCKEAVEIEQEMRDLGIEVDE